ncbi:hydroxymethylglutaryl-CoA lyase [Kineobactrum salinum]|uniref:Hydroxymethylglutaryl-CoA lyase n=1 Tax=Kineobactrum salinum TaxID=2708301 RepID=A0A6C0U1B1_9GAMM|nr:hydroxymethylglutaryl-CoA lyase [Kineobactrum salinum]QIB65912.1 hydroxymethylglutaryl-CoA lyase [Kineobactrum salinum]
MAETVIVNDVGPRDGLQNQSRILAPEQRLQLIGAIRAAGLDHIEVGSFVSPKAVPAMAGADSVVAGLQHLAGGHYSALIPNLRGYELARDSGVKAVVMVLYGSQGMARRNVNMSREEADTVAGTIIERAREEGLEVIITMAVAFECPFDGPVDSGLVADVAGRFLALGAERFVLADTIGAANPQQVRDLTRTLVDRHGSDRLGCHFHDTRALGLANVYAAVESGIRYLDASIASLGGCPFAPGASGNVATEDVVMLMEQLGFATGVDLEQLLVASDLAETLTGTAPGGRAKAWLRPWLAGQEAVDDTRQHLVATDAYIQRFPA